MKNDIVKSRVGNSGTGEAYCYTYKDFTGHLTYTVVDRISQPEKLTFAMADILGSLSGIDTCPELVEIKNISVKKDGRLKGSGTKLVEHLIAEHKDSIVVAVTYLSIDEYPVEPSAAEGIDIMEGLDKFYKSCGFVDVNHLYGQYESKNVYMYNNEAAKELNRVTEERVADFIKTCSSDNQPPTVGC